MLTNVKYFPFAICQSDKMLSNFVARFGFSSFALALSIPGLSSFLSFASDSGPWRRQ